MSSFEQLRTAIATTLRIPAETINVETSTQNTAAWDSLGHVNLMMTLEQTFDIALDVEDFPRLNSVKSILEYLRDQRVGD